MSGAPLNKHYSLILPTPGLAHVFKMGFSEFSCSFHPVTLTCEIKTLFAVRPAFSEGSPAVYKALNEFI